jgi:hypothetical protein
MGCYFCNGGNESELPRFFVSAPPERAWMGGWQPVCSACEREHSEALAAAADEFFFGGM